jgi:K+-sensing histidine kinase KdpD
LLSKGRNWGYLIVLVSDSGTCVTEDKSKALFDTFMPGQVVGASGIGVGLTTAKNLANALGGEVYLQSMENVGTDVTFSV